MSQIVNLTDYQVAPLVNTGLDGLWQITAIVKASYKWDESGRCTPTEAQPVLLADEYVGEPGLSGYRGLMDVRFFIDCDSVKEKGRFKSLCSTYSTATISETILKCHPHG